MYTDKDQELIKKATDSFGFLCRDLLALASADNGALGKAAEALRKESLTLGIKLDFAVFRNTPEFFA